MDDDLRAFMLYCLEVEKRALCEDLDEYYCAVAVLITPQGRVFEFAEFEDEKEKIAAYQSIVEKATINAATAIITINSARVGSEPMTPDDLDGYWWGKLAAEGARDCISITVSGPGMQSYGLDLGYEIVDGEVRFDPTPSFEMTEVGMLPDWPGDLPTVPN